MRPQHQPAGAAESQPVRAEPTDFLWGVAMGAHQSEGNNLASGWWSIEHAADTFVREPSGDAIDGYHRWAQDMDLATVVGATT